MKKNYIIPVLLFLLITISCKKEVLKLDEKNLPKSEVKYAKGFDIIDDNGTKKLMLKSSYKGSKEVFNFTIRKKNKNKILKNVLENDILVPIKKIVVTSTTHIPMIELLNEETSIIGFPYSKYVSSHKTRNLIDEGKIKEIGKESSLNTEILLDLKPELVVGYSVAAADKSLSTVKKAGINVIYNGDWLEETPLGRAEWIKFFGVLFDKEKQADSIFKVIEANYLNAKQIALKSTKKPTILSGAIMSKDIWNLPAGESFVATFLKDANTNYLWRNTKGTGSLSLNLENVYQKGRTAELWISPGFHTSLNSLKKSNVFYTKFDAYKNKNVYSFATTKGETGGLLYFELASSRPDLVLKDLIKIAHPELLQEEEFTFFEKLK